jgi:hypothetical protein
MYKKKSIIFYPTNSIFYFFRNFYKNKLNNYFLVLIPGKLQLFNIFMLIHIHISIKISNIIFHIRNIYLETFLNYNLNICLRKLK